MTGVPKPSDLTATYTATYDAWNRLVEVKSGANVVLKCEYDGLNRRTKKCINTGEDQVCDEFRHFFYNSGWQILETRLSESENTAPDGLQPEYQYVWSLRYIDAPVLRDENTDEDDLCDDERLYYLTDANMNVTCLTDTGGDAVERYVYDPYGNVTVYNSDWSATVAWAASKKNNIRYCGYYFDNETGLYSVRNRTLHPYLGWLQRDPTGQYADGANLYEYVSSNPLGYADPFGAQKEPVKQITFTVTRAGGTYATLGTFTMKTDGISDLSGFTLELRKGKYDIGIGKGAKEYPIPQGTYEAEPAPRAKGGQWGLLLKDVPNFDGILVHVGNWPWDTWGCILVGTSQVPNMKFTIGQMTSKHQKKWGFYRDLGFLKETKAEAPQEGITDFIGGSNAALIKMKKHYDAAVKKHGGVKCVTIVVIVKAVKAVG